MSTHAIEIVEIGEIKPHPNADRMETTQVWGWNCCIGKGQFKPGDRAIYVPPDYTVPTNTDTFSFLKREGRDRERITVKKLRGVISQGLLTKVPEELGHLVTGSDVMEELGIERYEAPLPKIAAEGTIPGPRLQCPKFDVESFQRYGKAMFSIGEEIIVTEKIHGANARYLFSEGVFWVGSRTNWWKVDPPNMWWRAADRNPDIRRWCENHTDIVLYGEVFGQVQDLKYGAGKDDLFFAAFAAMNLQDWKWIDRDEIQFPDMTPLVYRGKLESHEMLYEMAERDSEIPGANHCAEGIVVTPVHERFDSRLGRTCLKIVSNRYMERT